MKKYIGVLGPALLVLYGIIHISIYSIFFQVPAASVLSEEVTVKSSEYKGYEELLLSFAKNHLMGEAGEIFANLTPSQEGPEVLSESIGILMDYSLLKGDRELFDMQFKYLKENMMTKELLIRWRISKKEAYCNAAIDDLRITRALLEAYNLWQDRSYFDTAGFIQEGLYDRQAAEGMLYEFYDWNSRSPKRAIPLCYIDLYTLNRISLFNEGWGRVMNKGAEILKYGRISENSPFFYKYYDYKTGKYSLDEEYAKDKGINLTYTLYTLLHLAEANEDTEYFTQWLKGEVEKGKVNAWYNPYSLKPAKEMENPSVYALSAIYAKKTGEEKLYKDLIDKMLGFMIINKESPYYGGIGDEASKSFYSFDILTALWALAIERP